MSLGYVGKQELNKKHDTESSSTSTALDSKQGDLTQLSTFDAKKSQTLQNDNGTIKWVENK